MIKRTGTGDDPVTGFEEVVFVPLPQPATFKTVTFTFPYGFVALMKTCRNPMMVTGVVLPVLLMVAEV